jgi:hypothetical protein
MSVNDVRFAEGILHVQLSNNTSMLIPLEWPVMDRFLKWLTPRTLTAHEECVYGLRDKNCWAAGLGYGASRASVNAPKPPRSGLNR